jgi:ABC-type multidrug transport system ATPase subunit
MEIHLEKIGKKFNYQWIFRGLDLTINHGEKWVILGGNGSGKSTFLQLIAGINTPSEGSIHFQSERKILVDDFHKNLSICAPYIDIFPALKLEEMIEAHFAFKPLISSLQLKDLPEIFELAKHKHKSVEHFSSGMKQRLKLGLAITTNVPILLLDEPLNNLDNAATNWYQEMIKNYAANKTIVVCSNAIEKEYEFCDKSLNLEDFKLKKI